MRNINWYYLLFAILLFIGGLLSVSSTSTDSFVFVLFSFSIGAVLMGLFLVSLFTSRRNNVNDSKKVGYKVLFILSGVCILVFLSTVLGIFKTQDLSVAVIGLPLGIVFAFAGIVDYTKPRKGNDQQ